MHKKLKHRKINRSYALVVILLLGFFTPVTLMAFGIIPYEWRFQVFITIGVILLIYLWLSKVTARDLGLRTDNFRKSAVMTSWLTAAALAVLMAGYLAGFYSGMKWILPVEFFVFYIFILAPLQELLFRSMMFYELKQAGIRSIWLQILVSAVVFSYLHLVYWDAATMLATLVMGVVWGYIYAKAPNLITVSISHAVLGVSAMLFGLI